MPMKVALQALSQWFTDCGSLVKDTAKVALETGALQDLAEDLGEVGGIAGTLLKLGARLLPEATPEERLLNAAAYGFVQGLDHALLARQPELDRDKWRAYYSRGAARERAQDCLAQEFTWLSVITSDREIKPRHNWTLVEKLTALAKSWALGSGLPPEVANGVANQVSERLCSELDRVLTETDVEQALKSLIPAGEREALQRLAELQSKLDEHLLFGETPLSAVYVSPLARACDLAERDYPEDWGKVAALEASADEQAAAELGRGRELIIIEGDMGVGKSCLMVKLTARLAKAYMQTEPLPLYVRWRQIYKEKDLRAAIAASLAASGSLPLSPDNLQEKITFLVDGFDEMASHDDSYVGECFEELLKLLSGQCRLVVAMRSPVITETLRRKWKQRGALVLRVGGFDRPRLERWTQRWSQLTGSELSLEDLLRLAGESSRRGGRAESGGSQPAACVHDR